jgi:hypothetical protein
MGPSGKARPESALPPVYRRASVYRIELSWKWLPLALLSLLSAMVPVPAAAQISDELAARVQAQVAPSVLVILDGEDRALGSGVLIAPGLVATSCETLQALAFAIAIEDTAYPARMVQANHPRDLCILEADLPPGPVVEMTSAATTLLGTLAFIASREQNSTPRRVTGSIGEALPTGAEGSVPAMTMEAVRGSPGGGVFDAQGRLLGLVSMAYIFSGPTFAPLPAA